MVKSVNIWQKSYRQERYCLLHFARLANTLLNTKKVHETISFLVVNIHRLKKFFIHRLSNKPFLICLLKTSPRLKYVATVPCNLLLMACFGDVCFTR